MSPALNSILEKLPRLNAVELQTLKVRVGAELSLSGSSVGPTGSTAVSEDYVLDGLNYELKRRGLLAYSHMPKRAIPSDFAEKSAAVRKCLSQYMPTLKTVERAALGQLAARALADYLEAKRSAVTPFAMFNQVDRIPLALDMSYPGYLQAGMLVFCWRQVG